MAKRTTEQAEETRAAILAAARKLFTEQGFEASLSSIVAEAGITKGALFHHFENKKALFHEVWRELQVTMDKASRDAARANVSEDDPYSAFLAACKTYFSWTMRPDYQRIVLIDGPTVLGMADWYAADHDLGKDNVRRGIDYLVSRGKIAPERAPAYALLTLGALNGAGFTMSRADPEVTAEDIYKAFEVMLRSLR